MFFVSAAVGFYRVVNMLLLLHELKWKTEHCGLLDNKSNINLIATSVTDNIRTILMQFECSVCACHGSVNAERVNEVRVLVCL